MTMPEVVANALFRAMSGVMGSDERIASFADVRREGGSVVTFRFKPGQQRFRLVVEEVEE